MKNKIKKLNSALKEFKYEILMACEIIALVTAAIYYAFGRKKQFSFLTAFSSLLGAYISTSALYRMNAKMKSRKFIDIIAIVNEKSDVVKNSSDNNECDEGISINLEDDVIIENND